MLRGTAAALVYSTYLSSTGFGEGHAVAVDAAGNALCHRSNVKFNGNKLSFAGEPSKQLMGAELRMLSSKSSTPIFRELPLQRVYSTYPWR